MIVHGQRTVKLFSSGRNPRREIIKGYYLVLPNHDRYWIAENVNISAFEKLCDKHLRKNNNWNYWVDYCHGKDVDGNLHWENLDLTDRFLI